MSHRVEIMHFSPLEIFKACLQSSMKDPKDNLVVYFILFSSWQFVPLVGIRVGNKTSNVRIWTWQRVLAIKVCPFHLICHLVFTLLPLPIVAMALITKAIMQSSALSRSVFVRSFSVSALRTQARPLDSEFPVLTDPLMENKQLPSFMVGTENGFLPRQVC